MGDTQWEVLDGKPYTVGAKGRRYQEIAEAIQRSMGSLDNIVDQIDNKSLAMDATRELASSVKEDIEKARVRYADAGEALATYGDALETAKYEQADPAARELADLRGELDAAETAERNAASAVDDLPDDASDADRQSADTAATNATNEAAALRAEISRYEQQWTDGHEAKNTAAAAAKDKIHEVVYGSKVNGLKDGFWDKAKEIGSFLYKALKIICDIAGILAIFLSWVPVLGQVLVALAALGAILTIIEGIAKMATEGFSWGALGMVGLGVLGLFGGRAIGAVAKYAKARSVVQTSARLSTRASKVKFGNSLLKSSRKTFALTKGQRVSGVLTSPFLRSAGDKKIAGLLKSREWANAFKAKFPIPYKDGGMRMAFGNDDVVDMAKFFSQTGLRIDGATSAAMNTAYLGSITQNFINLGRNTYALGNDINSGNGWGVAGDANKIITQPAGGDYGKITGEIIKRFGG